MRGTQTAGPAGNVCAVYSKGVHLESRPEHPISWGFSRFSSVPLGKRPSRGPLAISNFIQYTLLLMLAGEQRRHQHGGDPQHKFTGMFHTTGPSFLRATQWYLFHLPWRICKLSPRFRLCGPRRGFLIPNAGCLHSKFLHVSVEDPNQKPPHRIVADSCFEHLMRFR
jgi:hypothetical protein